MRKTGYVRKTLNYIKILWADEREFYGLVIGVFFGFLPIHGIQMATAAAVAKFAKKSPIAAVIGTHVTNWWTTIPILFLNYKIGKFIISHFFIKSIPQTVFIPLSTFTGGIILGTFSSCLLILLRNILNRNYEPIQY